MKASEQLRAGADYIREYGFSVRLGEPGCPRCLIGALLGDRATLSDAISLRDDRTYRIAKSYLWRELGIDLREEQLLVEGWQADDAIAALEIAADIAEAEGV